MEKGTLLTRFNQTIDQWIAALDNYSLQQLHQHPQPGSWSLGQVYVHIIQDTQFFIDQIKSAIADTTNSGKQMHENAKKMFENNAFPDMQLENPSNDPNLRLPESIEEVREGLTAIKTTINNLTIDSKGKAEHPGLQFFTSPEWLQFAEMHMRHHLRQKKRIDISLIYAEIAAAIKDLPDETQVAIAFTHHGRSAMYGLIRKDNAIIQTDNATAAFEIGSVTKAFTGYILAQLVTEEKVRLDDLIQQYLPFRLLNDPPITLAQLAWHTSGLQRMPHNFETQSNYDNDNPFKNYTEEQLALYCSEELTLDNPPGESYAYSNFGSGLLSYIISRIEGKPFAAVVAERMFIPLKMRNSSFDVREVETTMVKGIDEAGNFCTHWDGGILNGCLGIISTAEDMLQFMLKIIDRSDVAANLQADTTHTLEPVLKSNLGWQERLIPSENVCMQGINGGTGGYGASVLLDREQQCGVTFLTNISPYKYLEKLYPLAKKLLIVLTSPY